MYENDVLSEFKKDVLGGDVEIIETPGHVPEHLSLLINTKDGRGAIAGDVFWWTDDEEQILDINQMDQSMAFDMDMEKLVESRKIILEKADYIIPGHGKMMKVDR